MIDICCIAALYTNAVFTEFMVDNVAAFIAFQRIAVVGNMRAYIAADRARIVGTDECVRVFFTAVPADAVYPQR